MRLLSKITNSNNIFFRKSFREKQTSGFEPIKQNPNKFKRNYLTHQKYNLHNLKCPLIATFMLVSHQRRLPKHKAAFSVKKQSIRVFI